MNSVARRRGWPLGSHSRMIENAHRLIRQDPAHAADRGRLLRSIEGLHANFYQAFLNEDSVRDGIEDAKELIRALEDLDTATYGADL